MTAIKILRLLATSVFLISCVASPTTITVNTTPEATQSDIASRISWLREHSISIRSVTPSDEDFADLQSLKRVIGSAKVVVLGEQSHGDGATFLAKTRLIKFLHQEMGFNILAFESGLYDCHKAWELIQQGESPASAIQQSVFHQWTESKQVQPLIEYMGRMAATTQPLELAGVDSQFSGSLAPKFLATDLATYLEETQTSITNTKEWETFSKILQTLTEHGYSTTPAPDPDVQTMFFAELSTLQASIAAPSSVGRRTASFWAQVLRSTDAQARLDWAVIPDGVDAEAYRIALRDEQMGKNLIWMSNDYYPDQKIIVWTHTFHGMHNPHEIDAYAQITGLLTMGDVAWKELGPQIYVLGVASYDGQIGIYYETPRSIGRPEVGSLEDLMNAADLDLAIVDFRHLPASGAWLQQQLVGRLIGYTSMKADWTQIMDGIMFIQTMTPSTAVQR